MIEIVKMEVSFYSIWWFS